MKHSLHEILVEGPELIKVVEKINANSPEVTYAYDILFTFANVFQIRTRKVLRVLSENKWIGSLLWMKSVFEQREIMHLWKSTIEMEKCIDPAFQEFMDKEIISAGTPKNKRS